MEGATILNGYGEQEEIPVEELTVGDIVTYRGIISTIRDEGQRIYVETSSTFASIAKGSKILGQRKIVSQ